MVPPERGESWSNIASTLLNSIKEPEFRVHQRLVRDHYFLVLEKNYREKIRVEDRASGICPPEETELEQGIREIMAQFQEHDREHQEKSEEKKKKAKRIGPKPKKCACNRLKPLKRVIREKTKAKRTVRSKRREQVRIL